MRILVYNIAYGTLPPRYSSQWMLAPVRFFRSPHHHFRRLIEFIAAQSADIVGLVEVDSGSVRTHRVNQIAVLARALGHRWHSAPKYGTRRYPRYVPILRHQTNAILARVPCEAVQSHYLPRGFKRLVLHVRTNGLNVFLVHLPLRERARRVQIRALAHLVREVSGPILLAGDFNVLHGPHELEDLLQATGLRSANKEHRPTFPAWRPKHELDFILHSPDVRIRRFRILDEVRLSDHLPLVLDFDV